MGLLQHNHRHPQVARQGSHEDEQKLLDASEYMDMLERKHTIRAGLEGCLGAKRDYSEVAEAMGQAAALFGYEKKQKFG